MDKLQRKLREMEDARPSETKIRTDIKSVLHFFVRDEMGLVKETTNPEKSSDTNLWDFLNEKSTMYPIEEYEDTPNKTEISYKDNPHEIEKILIRKDKGSVSISYIGGVVTGLL